MRLFRNESGFALPLALLVMVTTSAILVTAITTTSSTGRTANLGKTAVSAQALAEAGLANGVSILAKPGQNTNTQALFPSTEATALSYTMENGTAKLWGVYNSTTNVWTLYAKGILPNPTGAAPVTKSLSRTAQVLGIAAGATVPEWSRFIHDDASTCFTIDTVTIPGAVASRGPMCLKNGGNVAVNSTGAATTVGVGDNPHRRGAGRREPRASSPRVDLITADRVDDCDTSIPADGRQPDATYTVPCCNAFSGSLETRGFFNSPVGTTFRPPRSFAGFRSRSSRMASATSSIRRRGRAICSRPASTVGHRPRDAARTGATSDDHGDLRRPDRPLGHDLDACPDQRQQLRRSAEGRQPAAPRPRICLDQPRPRDRHVHRQPSRRRRSGPAGARS